MGPPGRRPAGRFRVIVPDLRGHGDSSGQFDFDSAVEDILDLLDHLAVSEVVLVGLSLGANIACLRTWAQRDPHARYVVIPHAGHASNFDNPDAFTAVLEDFLDEVVPAESAVRGRGSTTAPERLPTAGTSRSSAA